MQLTAEQIQQNWLRLIGFIEDHISEPRKTNLIDFYEKYSERLMLMPAAHKIQLIFLYEEMKYGLQ